MDTCLLVAIELMLLLYAAYLAGRHSGRRHVVRCEKECVKEKTAVEKSPVSVESCSMEAAEEVSPDSPPTPDATKEEQPKTVLPEKADCTPCENPVKVEWRNFRDAFRCLRPERDLEGKGIPPFRILLAYRR